jgi:hypothetical protein
MFPAPPPRLNPLAPKVALVGTLLLAVSGCSPAGSISDADVPAWQATALPEASGSAFKGSGKILDRDPVVHGPQEVAAGNYILSMVCDGGGKAFFEVSTVQKDGAARTEIADAGAACNGSLERYRLRVPDSGRLDVTVSSVDAPLIYAFQLVPMP